ncbi:MAG: Zn-dependent hydrolase [Advenella sp.]
MINQQRLFNRLLHLSEIGKTGSGGVTRLALTEKDQQGIALLSEFMKEAGMQVRTDAAGNLIGTKQGRDAAAPVVLTGSHSDTIVEGGIFDGALGIIGAIEAVQSMNERNILTAHSIEVCAYRDEEGCRFTSGYSGSRIMTGQHDPEKLRRVDRDGVSVSQALQALGIDPDSVGLAARSPASVKAHVELHIEQGNVLENEGYPVGIVTGICASSRSVVTITGQARHAGTTPMTMRRDPMAAAAAVIHMIEREALSTGTTVATVGSVVVSPGAVNVIAGSVVFSLDCRDIDEQVRDRVLDHIINQAKQICQSRLVDFDIQIYGRGGAKPCSEQIQEQIKLACQQQQLQVFILPSGAGHDSGSFHNFCPMGMIFVRSRDGISHNPAEWSTPQDCAAGANVLYRTLLALAVVV